MSNTAIIVTQEWVDSLVGRDWEIFWKQSATNNKDAATATPMSATTVQATTSAAMMHTTEKAAVAAAADADADAMEIDGVENVKHGNGDHDDLGDADDSSSSSSFAEDWYHGRVVGVVPRPAAANANTSHGQEAAAVAVAVFHVRFEGDDAIYDMALYPENVRPCAKSWIRRTRCLLLDTAATSTSENTTTTTTQSTMAAAAANGVDGKFWWERQLPPDTRMLSDEPYLQQIQQTIEAEFRHATPIATATTAAAAAAAAAQPLQDGNSSGSNTDDGFESILRLTVFLEQQIYLRSKLAPITFFMDDQQPSPSSSLQLENAGGAEHETTKSTTTTTTTIIDAPPSEAYCSYLVQCLNELKECCRWYCCVYPIVTTVAAAASTTTTPVLLEGRKFTRDDFFQSCIEGGRATMARLISLLDSSLAGMKRKRKRGPMLIFSKTVSSSSSSSSLPTVAVSSASCTNAAAAAAAAAASSSIVSSSSSVVAAATVPLSVTSTAAAAAAAAVPCRRTKRQRRMYKTDGSGTDCYWQKSSQTTAEQDATTLFLQGLHVEDFLSTAMVKRLVQSMVSYDKRWYSICIGHLLLKLSSNIIGPFIKWERKAEYYLGDRDTLPIESSSDGETSGEDSDNDDDDEEKEDGENKAKRRRDSQRMVKYEEIESLVDLAQRDAVLSRFELGAFVKRLEEKFVAIDVFQEECWNAISKVLDEDGTNHADCNAQANDETLKNLKGLLKTANSKESAVGNVEPFGKESALTRCVLENAIVYRTWFLDVLYTETVRERVALVDGVVSRLSKLPSLPSRAATTRANGTSSKVVDISIKLDAIAPRVQALSAKCVDNVALISRYMALLSNPPCNGDQETFDMDAALGALKNVPVVSVVEEKTAVRRDMQVWAKKAQPVLGKSRPAYEDLAKLKVGLHSIFQGQSPTRKDIVKNLRSNAEVEAEIKAFAKSDDVLAFCRSNNEQSLGLHQRCLTLYFTAESWKDRCDAILATLRAYGNVDAGPVVGVSTPKATNMIDLKRIDDLLREYQSLEVDLNAEHHFLRKVNEHAVAWSSAITSQLLDDNASFTQMLHFVEAGNRPSGIIIDPTRQVMDLLAEFLRWHAAVKAFVNTLDDQDDNVSARLYPILVTGLEVVELYNNSRPCPSHKFVFETKETMRLLSERLDSRKPCRVLSRSKLEASAISLSVLSRVVDQARDRVEGDPLMSLVYCIWQIHAEDFAKRNSSADSPRSQFTVDVASELNKSKPVVEGSPVLDMIAKKNKSHWSSEFESLVAEGEAMEHSVTRAFAASKRLLRTCLRGSQDVNAHLVTLKDLQTTARTQTGSRPKLSLNKALEQHLENNVKMFSWVVRALQFPVLLHESTDSDDETSGDDRISYEVLVKLYDSRPTPEQEDMKDFACLLIRVCELHKAARAWQEEVSNLTMISLRGGKRRTSPMKGEGPDDEPSRIDVGKVSKLCNHKILKKVAMPREEAIRAMSQGTEKFEIMLDDLFANDYDGQCPDRAPYPSGRSLVGDDGGLVIRRLTFSPLFVKIKESIIDIQAVANDVFAETPGKKAFEWIAQSVSWIDSLSAAMVHEKNAEGRLVLPTLTGRRLLKEGESVLLELPDDLRRTLSSHGVFVSTNKDGKLTVKSKKDGSHHSLGTTVILWSPILLEALRKDISKSRKWEQSVTCISKEVIEFQFHKPSDGRLVPKDESAVLQVHRFLKEISNLADECSDLVVAPSKGLIDAMGVLKSTLEDYIKVNSNPEISKKALEGTYCAASAVVRDRFLLLDALVGRCAVASGPIEPPDDKTSKDLPFRSACRGFIEKALQKATAIMDLSQHSRDTDAFSRFKAWEIEEALFQEFQGALGNTRMSKQYLEQAKALKRGLEDPENTTLCLRILAEDISSKSLTQISSDQLANPKVRRARAKAEADAREAAVLTRDMSTASVAQAKEPSKKPPAIRTQSQPILAKETANAKKPSPESGTKKMGTKLGDIVKTVRTSLPPPPPPSLAALPLERTGAPLRSSRGRQISSSSGKDRFYLSLAEGKRKFSAGFYLEDDSTSPAEIILPDQLAQTGRLPIAEFCKFVAGKMESGNWDTILLRLVPASEADAREYKKFYKEYEAKQRIAMLSLENSAKCFLLTPKFHKDAKHVLALNNATSTYGVLLMRR